MNMYTKLPPELSIEHAREFLTIQPSSPVSSPLTHDPLPVDDELKRLDAISDTYLRDLFLGITHRAAGEFGTARSYFEQVAKEQTAHSFCKWLETEALVELAILEMEQVPTEDPFDAGEEWKLACSKAEKRLDEANSRHPFGVLEWRVKLLRDQIELKRHSVGVA